MSAFLIAFVKRVHDRKRLEEYWSKVGPTFEGTGAKPISVYTPFELVEGNGPVAGHVLVEFPDVNAARAWYFGKPYQAIRALRDGAADIDILIAEGGVVREAEKRMPSVR
jgi:uncharacterized protein (DUF1330 family)